LAIIKLRRSLLKYNDTEKVKSAKTEAITFLEIVGHDYEKNNHIFSGCFTPAFSGMFTIRTYQEVIESTKCGPFIL